jgi:hypothetical protein
MNKTKFQLKIEQLGFDSYESYLKSDHWKAFRTKYWNRHKNKCYCCGSTKKCDLHHITYEHLGQERQKDVKPLCRSCHDKVHAVIHEYHVPLEKAHELLIFILNS